MNEASINGLPYDLFMIMRSIESPVDDILSIKFKYSHLVDIHEVLAVFQERVKQDTFIDIPELEVSLDFVKSF